MNVNPDSDPTDLDTRLREVNRELAELAEQQEANNAAADAITMGGIDNMSDGASAQKGAELLSERARLLMAKAVRRD